MLWHHRYLAALALATLPLRAEAQAVIRGGVTYHEAGNVILSVIPDSLDGVHVYANPREGVANARVGFSGRFDPAQLTAWLRDAETLALDSAGPMPESRERQSAMLDGLDGTIGLVVGRLWKDGHSGSTLYWVLRGTDGRPPLLIEADVTFSQRLAAALRLAATHSHVDSAAFASGLVEPIGCAAAADSLTVRLVGMPVPSNPKKPPVATGGVVEVRYIVDAKGRVDLTTFEVLGATDAAFVPPVKAALSSGSFRPARYQGMQVRRRVWQRIRFRDRDALPAVEFNPGTVLSMCRVSADSARKDAVTAVDDPVQVRVMPRPRYPAELSGSGISGRVELQYIVDTTGHAEPNSLKVVSYTHEAFIAPAKEAILRGVFKPAQFKGRPVRQLVQQAISFRR